MNEGMRERDGERVRREIRGLRGDETERVNWNQLHEGMSVYGLVPVMENQ